MMESLHKINGWHIGNISEKLDINNQLFKNNCID
jgi:hypothetical protein